MFQIRSKSLIIYFILEFQYGNCSIPRLGKYNLDFSRTITTKFSFISKDFRKYAMESLQLPVRVN